MFNYKRPAGTTADVELMFIVTLSSPAIANAVLWACVTEVCHCHFLCLDAKKVTKEKSRLQKNELKFTAFRDNE